MPNKRYIAGRRLEHLMRDKLEKAGYYVCRSAGSKGTADLVAIRFFRHEPAVQVNGDGASGEHEILLVSCKKGEWVPPKERAEMLELGRRIMAGCYYTKKGSDGSWKLEEIKP